MFFNTCDSVTSIGVVDSSGALCNYSLIDSVTAATSVNHINFEEVNIFPNPSPSLITIDLTNYWQSATASISNLMGQEITQFKFDAPIRTLELPKAKGIYILTIRINNTIKSYKLIKK